MGYFHFTGKLMESGPEYSFSHKDVSAKSWLICFRILRWLLDSLSIKQFQRPDLLVVCGYKFMTQNEGELI